VIAFVIDLFDPAPGGKRVNSPKEQSGVVGALPAASTSNSSEPV
jgi:hypothetical protein